MLGIKAMNMVLFEVVHRIHATCADGMHLLKHAGNFNAI